MKEIKIKAVYFPSDQIPEILEENGILINRYAKEYFSHPRFSMQHPEEMTVLIASLQEIGFENGATLDEIFMRISQIGLKPCPSGTGLFLRLAWIDQPKSSNSILSGTHSAPDQAVTVLSEILEKDDAFRSEEHTSELQSRI